LSEEKGLLNLRQQIQNKAKIYQKFEDIIPDDIEKQIEIHLGARVR
jgi:hypothetical protein